MVKMFNVLTYQTKGFKRTFALSRFDNDNELIALKYLYDDFLSAYRTFRDKKNLTLG
jgi:hypothetical protein